jgi:quinohemoprotein ethanol dehydrogenase
MPSINNFFSIVSKILFLISAIGHVMGHFSKKRHGGETLFFSCDQQGMKIFARLTGHCTLLATVLLCSSLHGQQNSKGLKTLGQAEEWVTTGGNYAETRHSTLKQINDSNVERMGLAWYYDTDAAPGSLEASPLVSNGTLYATLTWDVVFALDAKTGRVKWRYDPHISQHNFPPNSQDDPNRLRTGPTILSPVNRGVALYDGKIYVGLLDGRLIALDAESGKLVWEVQTTDSSADYSITGAPRIVRGNVIIGNAGGEFAVRGYVSAYDAQTGKLAWRFYTVPGDPSKPFENEAMKRAAKTWTGDTWYKLGGGGEAWDAFAYDPDLDLLYFGTANGSPWAADWRSPGGGDNLYVCSILAVRASTGEYVWHYQEVPGDEWDYDAVQDLILAEVSINGHERKVIMQAAKDGYFYVLDRQNGKLLSAAPFAYVTWSTGIDQKTGRPIEAPDARYDTKGIFLSPSNGGGHNWPTMSFNPDTGLAYIPATNSTFFYKLDVSHFIYRLGFVDRGLSLDPARPSFQQPLTAPPPDRPKGSFLLAWDPARQKEAWRFPEINGGTVTTAGNLVFSSSTDGHFMAFRADKGEKLWEVQLAPGFGSPITYMLEGKQYVSVLAGRIGHGRLYTFALDGKLPIPSTLASGLQATTEQNNRSATTSQTTQNGVYSDVQAARGKAQYLRNCAACHMVDLSGSAEARPLSGSSFRQAWSGRSVQELFSVISTTMPQGSPGSLPSAMYADITAYIFKANGLPSSSTELTDNPEALKSIAISF